MSDPTPPAVSDAMREAVARETRWPILKAMAANYHDGHRWDHLDATACAQGADEIRGLRSEIARLTGERDELASFKTEASAVLREWEAVSDKCADLITRQGSEIARLHAAEAETARLRAALEEIAKGAPVTEPHPWDGELDTVCWNTAQIARAALTSQEKTDV